ncbi:scarecrow-like protein 13 [Apium graveolens]|uniref:scarecrow-like protein 13 n=1 Tax=Apium graveolens TaxID=4045 RepID=UPI003D7A0C83
MQTYQGSQTSGAIHRLYHQPMQHVEPYCASQFQILNNSVSSDNSSQETPDSFHYNEQFFTLDSFPADYAGYHSPSAASTCSRSPLSAQFSLSNRSDQHQSPDNTYGSPTSGSSLIDDGDKLKHALKQLESKLVGPRSDTDDVCSYSTSVTPEVTSMMKYNKLSQTISTLDVKQLLLACAEVISDGDISNVAPLMNILEHMVSVTGEPMQRLGAYMMEGIKARLISSGSIIYKKLKCKNEPTSSELMSYMGVIYQIVPFYKFAYMSSNVIIEEVMKSESRIHIIDFQIVQGSQWVPLIQALAARPGGPPIVRITGVDDSNAAYARGGGLQLVGDRLSKVAESCGVPFEFNGAAISGSEVKLENLRVQQGEALAVNFPYVLHHMPDESVSTTNHRDRLLRLIKSLSPKVVTLVEQESNTNTSPFLPRFRETLEYYEAMFEAIDTTRARDDRQRISAEEHCVARDIVNMIACEGAERVERHELFGKWRLRLSMAGYTQCQLSYDVDGVVKNMLKEYDGNFRLEHRNGALYLKWKNRDLVTCSAWR